jgi:8-oxo-dGTP pyrophosphatase MutT (NUDIX family)
MNFAFDKSFRSILAERCAAFTPLVVSAEPGLKRAAVAVTVVPAEDGAGAAVLLTRRAKTLRSHGGQWALPGGRCEEGELAVSAALRELEEELGLTISSNAVLGLLDDYPTRSGYLIRPVIIWAEGDVNLRPDPKEVESVHRVPLAALTASDAVSFVTIPESERPVIRLKLFDRHVHAPTAAVLHQFAELALGRVTRVRDYEQPVFAWK